MGCSQSCTRKMGIKSAENEQWYLNFDEDIG